MYSAGAGDRGSKTGGANIAADVPTFLKNVAKFVEMKQADCVIQDDEFVRASGRALVDLANGRSFIIPRTNREEGQAEFFRMSLESIKYDFIHVRHSANFGKPMDQRIYLNLAVKGRGLNFTEIVKAVYDYDGFRSAKVSSPDGPPRNDTALLYMADETAVNFAIGKIADSQKDNAGAFLPGLPRLTSPISNLTGVGRGMEPPSYAVIRQGGKYYKKSSSMSFGWWRSALIFMALDRTYWKRAGQSDEQRRAAFKRRAAKYFRAAGIDPENPSVQTNPDDLPDYPA